MGHWWHRSAIETAAAINRREVSALEVVESHIARMDEVNAHLNAVTVRMDEEARRAARAADEAMAAGAPVGPLHGVPVTIKENVDVAGQATTNGIPAFADNVATADSPVVAHLRNAGAIIIGRTNTPEFSFRWFTDNPSARRYAQSLEPGCHARGLGRRRQRVPGRRRWLHRPWKRRWRFSALSRLCLRRGDRSPDARTCSGLQSVGGGRTPAHVPVDVGPGADGARSEGCPPCPRGDGGTRPPGSVVGTGAGCASASRPQAQGCRHPRPWRPRSSPESTRCGDGGR